MFFNPSEGNAWTRIVDLGFAFVTKVRERLGLGSRIWDLLFSKPS